MARNPHRLVNRNCTVWPVYCPNFPDNVEVPCARVVQTRKDGVVCIVVESCPQRPQRDSFKGDTLTPIQAHNRLAAGLFTLYTAQCIRGRPDSDRKPRTRCAAAGRHDQHNVPRK